MTLNNSDGSRISQRGPVMHENEECLAERGEVSSTPLDQPLNKANIKLECKRPLTWLCGLDCLEIM